jgi:hypothetical protein
MSRRLLGTIRTPHAIEQRTLALLTRYLPLYLDEVARQDAGGGSFPRPPRPDLYAGDSAERIPDGQLPALLVTLEGTVDAPLLRPTADAYAACWRLRLTALAAGEEESSRALAAVTATAASAVCVQLLRGGAGITGVRWSGESNERMLVGDTGAQTPRAVSTRTLDVDVAEALGATGRPPDPLDPPQDPGTVPTVETTELVVNPVEEIDA